jgi:hypothetical protein
MYDFRTLSPIDFELLVRDQLQAELRITMESFGLGKDGGIDFRFSVADEDVIVRSSAYEMRCCWIRSMRSITSLSA